MVHSDVLNSLTDKEKIILLACVQHATGKAYQYNELSWIQKSFFVNVLQKYHKIVKKDQKELYEQMVEKINPQLKLL